MTGVSRKQPFDLSRIVVARIKLLDVRKRPEAVITYERFPRWHVLLKMYRIGVAIPFELAIRFLYIMWIKVTCNLDFQMGTWTPLVLMLRPRSGAQQWIAREAYTLSPSVPVVEYTDIYGNLCQRLVAPYGQFSIQTSAEVMTADEVDREPGAYFIEIQNLPESVLAYLLPSRYCESDRFGDLAQDIAAGMQPSGDPACG